MRGISRITTVAITTALALAIGDAVSASPDDRDGAPETEVASRGSDGALDLYAPALVSQPDTRAQGAFDEVTRFLGVPFFGLRALMVVPGAAAGEIGNGLLALADRPAPGTVPHAEPGRLWNGALRSLREDWRESTPGR